MAEWEKDRRAETISSGSGGWGTAEGSGSSSGLPWKGRQLMTVVNRAWRSGHALMQLLHDLDQTYPGQVRVLAHSMGNVVMGAALHEAPKAYVNTYIAAQAAVPAHLYDPTLPSRLVDDSTWPITTPDVFSYYPGSPQRINYFAGFETKTINKIINYFNQDDYFLNLWWINTEMTKQDVFEK